MLFYRVYMKQVKLSFPWNRSYRIDPTAAQSTTIKHFSFCHVPPPRFGLSMIILRKASNEGIQDWQGLLIMCTRRVRNKMFSNKIDKNI
jgi:hypothetical protein